MEVRSSTADASLFETIAVAKYDEALRFATTSCDKRQAFGGASYFYTSPTIQSPKPATTGSSMASAAGVIHWVFEPAQLFDLFGPLVPFEPLDLQLEGID